MLSAPSLTRDSSGQDRRCWWGPAGQISPSETFLCGYQSSEVSSCGESLQSKEDSCQRANTPWRSFEDEAPHEGRDARPTDSAVEVVAD